MYVPSHSRIDDVKELDALIDHLRFATVVSVMRESSTPFASHVPLMRTSDGAELRGHFAAGNPHVHAVREHQSALAVFLGSHAYISPRWYANRPAVPTWNYTAVHVTGRFRALHADELAEDLGQMVQAHEGDRHAGGTITDEMQARLMQHIVGFAIAIERIEGKRKLGQHRSAEDQAGVRAALARQHGHAHAALLDPDHRTTTSRRSTP